MARMSIYVPDDLKSRMDEVGDSVNWSEVARPAFQQAVASKMQSRSRNMDTAVERLKASKALYTATEAEQGGRHGREWAELRAEYAELVALASLTIDDDFEEDDETSMRLQSILWRTLNPEGVPDFQDWREDVFGTSRLPVAYLQAWIEAAQEFFEEVKDHLD